MRAVGRVRGLDDAEARALVEDFVADRGISVAVIGAQEGEIALDAHRAYGKGQHPAALNMGDCFAYACAKQLDASILFKGNDSKHTDLTDGALG